MGVLTVGLSRSQRPHLARQDQGNCSAYFYASSHGQQSSLLDDLASRLRYGRHSESAGVEHHHLAKYEEARR
jgi:hypothetical protein